MRNALIMTPEYTGDVTGMGAVRLQGAVRITLRGRKKTKAVYVLC